MQPKPMPTKVTDVLQMPDTVAKQLETSEIFGLPTFTSCLCANCALHTAQVSQLPVGCSSKQFCFKCCESKSACDCLQLTTERPFCGGVDACFCLKCVACTSVGSCCDFPCPMDQEMHQLCCNWEKQETVCAGGSSGFKVCCNYYNDFKCLEVTETPCVQISRCWIFECRHGCLPGMNKEVPLNCVCFGKKLWEKA